MKALADALRVIRDRAATDYSGDEAAMRRDDVDTAAQALAAYDAQAATGGRWEVDAAGWRVIVPRSLPEYCDDVQFDIPEGLDERDNAQHLATAHRIVACVNACAGIKDPAALVAAARGILGNADASVQRTVTVPVEVWRALAGAFS